MAGDTQAAGGVAPGATAALLARLHVSQAQQSTPGITRRFRGQPRFAVRGLSPGECALKSGRVLDGDFSTFLVARMTKQII